MHFLKSGLAALAASCATLASAELTAVPRSAGMAGDNKLTARAGVGAELHTAVEARSAYYKYHEGSNGLDFEFDIEKRWGIAVEVNGIDPGSMNTNSYRAGISVERESVSLVEIEFEKLKDWTQEHAEKGHEVYIVVNESEDYQNTHRDQGFPARLVPELRGVISARNPDATVHSTSRVFKGKGTIRMSRTGDVTVNGEQITQWD